MEITRGNLQTLFTAYNAAFEVGLGQAPAQWSAIAMPVPSSTRTEEYGWLGRLPGVREWIGPRQINALSRYSYSITNRKWEETIEVDRDDIEDDRVGIYNQRFMMLGEAVGAGYDQLVFGALKAGFATPCYDRQNFFDPDHPVIAPDGTEVGVANTDAVAGVGPPWFLFQDNRPVKPLILQQRRPWRLVRKDREEDDNTFFDANYLYGADARYSTGYGFWQYCWGSKQPLTSDSYAAARAALLGMVGDQGRPIGVLPNTLMVPPALEGAARKIVVSDRNDYGATNEWAGTAKPVVVPWLAGLPGY